MTDSDPSTQKATAADRAKARTQIFTEAINHIILVNGGAVVALLAFLQAIWDKDRELARVILYGIGFMLMAIVVCLAIPFIRILHSHWAQAIELPDRETKSRTWLWWVYNCLAYVAIILFLAGCLYIVCGGLSAATPAR